MERKQKDILLCIQCGVGILGFGLFSLPTAAVYFGSNFFWGYIALAAAIALAGVLLFCTVFEETVYETCKAVVPRHSTWISILYAFLYTAVTAFLFSYYAHTVQNWFLDGVPRFLIALFLAAVSLYTAAKPAQDSARLIGFVGVFVLLTVVVMRFVMLFSGDVRNLMPMFEMENAMQLPGGVLFLSGFFVLVGLLGIFRMPRKRKRRSGAAAVVFAAFLFILAAAGCISVRGPVQTAQYLDSTVLAMKNLNLSKMDFLQRGDLVFIVTWSFLILCTSTLSCQIPYRTVCAVFPHVKRGWLYGSFFLLYVLCAAVVPSEELALVLLVYTSVGTGAVILIILPVVLLLVKRRKKR